MESKITVFSCEADEAKMFAKVASYSGICILAGKEDLSVNNAHLAAGGLCVSVGHRQKVGKPELTELKKHGVKYITTRSIGFDHIDIQAAQNLGIAVGNVAYSPGSVADYTIMLMLMSLRRMKSIIINANKNEFKLLEKRGKELKDMTVGIVGTGQIGSEVINRLHGFGSRIIAYDYCQTHKNVEYVLLDELLRQSDIISLHIPLNAETKHIINKESITKIKGGAIMVNTARGALIESKALLHALESEKLGGAALDVVEGEEELFYLDESKKHFENSTLINLSKMENVIISPHTAFYTEHALLDILENTLRNCINFERKINKWTS